MKTISIGEVTIGEGKPAILIPIIDSTNENILKTASETKETPCDIIEWRIDFYDSVEKTEEVITLAEKIKKVSRKPLLITFRTKNEGGNRPFDIEKYFYLYKEIIASKQIDFIDIEYKLNSDNVSKIIEFAHKNNVYVILSYHDFDKTPEKKELISILKKMDVLNGDICKVAVMPNSSIDVLRLLEATNEARLEINKPLITISMGDLGKVSRIAGEVFGSSATFGSLNDSSAPGQIDAFNLSKYLEELSIE